MIDPRTTNIIGQHVMIVKRSFEGARMTYGRGIVRVVDYQHGYFSFLVEAVGSIEEFGTHDGGLFQVTTADECYEVVVDREAR